jgi:hypothetical protein
MAEAVLTEDAVVAAVRRLLERHGWKILVHATAIQHGHDLVAERDNQRLIIEAKGAGSSKEGTARFGRLFTSNQVFDHVAKAVLKALRVVTEGRAWGGVAFPDNANHHLQIDQIRTALDQLQVAIFWVRDDGTVSVEAPWFQIDA